MTLPTGRQRMVALAAVASLAATALVPVAVADDDPRSPASLDVEVPRDDSGFSYQTSTRTEDTFRQTTGEFDMERFQFNVSYTSSNGTSQMRSVNASLALEGVYLFQDTNENGRFDLGDRVVRFDRVQPNRWARADHVETVGELEILRATTPLEGGGEIQFDVLVSPEAINLNPDERLRPFDNRIDVTIRDLEPPAEDIHVSLATRLESGQLDRTDTNRVQVDGDGADLRYGWSDDATRDGSPTPLNSTVVEQHVTRDGQDAEELFVVHAFDPGEEVKLQHSFQVEETDSPIPAAFTEILGHPLLYLGGLVAAVVVVGGNAWLKLHESDRGRGRTWRSSQE